MTRLPRLDAPHIPAAAGTAADLPLLVGDLAIVHTRRGPRLELAVRCGPCRGLHVHSWGLDAPTPTPRCAHCWKPSSPYRSPHGQGYLVYPKANAANAMVLREFAALTGQACTVERTGDRGCDFPGEIPP